jgi:hypothetical protein
VIVRIATQGQFRLPDDAHGRLNELDNEAVQAVDAGDEARLTDLLERMSELIRSEGQPVPDDELIASDIILPPPDTTLDEARGDFTGEGLIPD